MVRLEMTDGIVRRLAYEVGPGVAATTGWAVDLDGLEVAVIPRERGYEEIVLARLAGAGIAFDQGAPRNFLERIVEYMVESAIGGAYEPSTAKLVLVRENLDDSNLDGLRVVLAHELAHRAQHLRHPQLFAKVDSLARDAWPRLTRTPPEPGGLPKELLADIRSIMTLLESHATWVQHVLQKSRYPKARIEQRFGLGAILFALLGGDKLAQYTTGVPQVARAMRAQKADALFRAFA